MVSDGILLTFPSYLAHSVAPNESDKLRIGISFNMIFSLYAERLSGPLWESTVDALLAEYRINKSSLTRVRMKAVRKYQIALQSTCRFSMLFS